MRLIKLNIHNKEHSGAISQSSRLVVIVKIISPSSRTPVLGLIKWWVKIPYNKEFSLSKVLIVLVVESEFLSCHQILYTLFSNFEHSFLKMSNK